MNAREDSLWYRASRFVRRHPGGVATGVLILLAAAGFGTTLWETRLLIGAAGRALSGRAILTPLLAQSVFLAIVGFGVAAFLTRAAFRRAVGALAGGAVFMVVWVARLRINYAMSWLRSAFPSRRRYC